MAGKPYWRRLQLKATITDVYSDNLARSGVFPQKMP
jgi:hypothetical protein